jgi:hypothetical protein
VRVCKGLPWSLVMSFVKGEEQRNNGFAYCRQSLVRTPAQRELPKQQSLWQFAFCRFCCTNRGSPAVVPVGERQRGEREQQSYGTCCGAGFTIKQEADGTATIRYLVEEHNVDCLAMSGCGQRFRSRESTSALYQLVLCNPTQDTTWLIKQHMQPYAEYSMVELGFACADDVIDYWLECPDEAPRDAIVDEDDINNAKRAAAEKTFRLDDDDATSVSNWVKLHKHVVHLYEGYKAATKVSLSRMRPRPAPPRPAPPRPAAAEHTCLLPVHRCRARAELCTSPRYAPYDCHSEGEWPQQNCPHGQYIWCVTACPMRLALCDARVQHGVHSSLYHAQASRHTLPPL